MKKSMFRVLTLVLVAALLCSVSCCAFAEATWPGKNNINIIIPAKAGGVNDTIARFMQEYFQTQLGKTVVITNYDTKAVAYEMLRTAKNDGNTIMLQHTTLFAEAAGGNVEYDPTQELTVVGEIASLGVSAYIAPINAPYNTLTELVEYAKEHPGEVTCAYSARGMSHFQWGAIEKDGGCTLKMVDCSSEAEKLTNVAGGFIGLAGVTYSSAQEYADAGKLKIIAVANSPEICAEKGYEACEDAGYTTMAVINMYVWAPANVDAELVAAMNEALQAMTQDPNFIASMEKVGYPSKTVCLEDAVAHAVTEMTDAYALAVELGLSE